ncbi:hypothetical protein N9L02_03775, partial [Gammaproteobacteria bacterium]|nr:hypothetical protein [Gammaproteobacteria bacterium]
ITIISIIVIIAAASKKPIKYKLPKSSQPIVENISQNNLNRKAQYKNERIEKIVQTNKTLTPSSSIKKLAGQINKEYRIREDILRYIEKNIPADNQKAKNAAIKIAQRLQLIYYGATKEEALKLFEKQSLALRCLTYSLPNDWVETAEGIHKLMRNTSERDAHMWEISKSYFSGKILWSGNLSTQQKKDLCEQGNY